MNSLVGLVVFGLLFSQNVYAQKEISQGSGYASLLGGYAKPYDVDGRFGYGTEIGLALPNAVTGFGYFLTSSATERGADVKVTHYGIGGDFTVAQFYNMRVGARAGMVERTSFSSAFSFGPHVGWDFRVAPVFTLGVEPILMIDTGTKSGTSLYVLGNAKFWF